MLRDDLRECSRDIGCSLHFKRFQLCENSEVRHRIRINHKDFLVAQHRIEFRNGFALVSISEGRQRRADSKLQCDHTWQPLWMMRMVVMKVVQILLMILKQKIRGDIMRVIMMLREREMMDTHISCSDYRSCSGTRD